MSILRPKDGDYIVRGIFLLVCWYCVGGIFLTFLGRELAGIGGALLAFSGVTCIGIVGFWRYLKLDPSVYPQKEKLCTCGHNKSLHDSRGLLGCLNRWGYNLEVNRNTACRCVKFKTSRWWVTNARDSHDWSV